MGIFQGKTISFMIRKTAFHTGEKETCIKKACPVPEKTREMA